jgi:hypothetical protein
VRHDDLAAVVSTAPRMRYTLRREYLTAHEGVVEEAMRHSDVLPVSFGTLAESDGQVVGMLLKSERDRLHAYLDYVRDRVDLELKVYWNQEWLFHEIVHEHVEIRELRDFIGAHSPEATYFERIQLGELIEKAIHDKQQEEAAAIVHELAPLAFETKVNQELTDLMILNASFLVDKPQEATFDAAIQELSRRESGRLAFQYVGPVPPYNFVTVRVRWEDASDGLAV